MRRAHRNSADTHAHAEYLHSTTHRQPCVQHWSQNHPVHTGLLRVPEAHCCCHVTIIVTMYQLTRFWSRALAQSVSHRLVTAEARVRSQVSPCGVCSGQSGNETGFYRVFRFPPVTIIPPLLHNYSCLYHKCCVILGIDSVVEKHTLEERKILIWYRLKIRILIRVCAP
jgi:hypothetical protein